MDVEQLRHYCLNKKAVTEDFPFDEDTLVFKVLGKIFAILPLERWERGEASMNLKCEPEYAEELRGQYNSIRPGFHMNKKHWNTLYIHEGELEIGVIRDLIDHSYDRVLKSMSKKMQNSLKDL